MNVLVTGAAGFIGSHLVERLLARGDRVVAIDALSDYYDVDLKRARIARIARSDDRYDFIEGCIADPAVLCRAFAHGIEGVVHLAAQVGVRHSIDHPAAYVDTNLVGFSRVIEAARRNAVQHFVYASSSSVYGANRELPFSEAQAVDHPISLYAATKKANELLAHSYSHLFALPTTGLRFFTVYGPWGRPDMALFKFTDSILAGRPIMLFGHGEVRRDFTYIDDVVSAVVAVLDKPPAPATDPVSNAPYRVLNIGNHDAIEVPRIIRLLEECLGVPAIIEPVPMQDGDIHTTWADVRALESLIGRSTWTPIEVGVRRFVDWYLHYYQSAEATRDRDFARAP